MVDAAFAYFDKTGDHRVCKREWEEVFKTLLSERANLSRTITDQEKCDTTLIFFFLLLFSQPSSIAGILSRVFMIFFWFIGLFVCLVLLRVPISAFLPAATFILSFSFGTLLMICFFYRRLICGLAFGNSLKNVFESLLLVLVIRAFNVGDVIEVDEHVYKVARVFTLTTEAYRTDGRLFILPNPSLLSGKFCNRTRSRPYTLVCALELGMDVRSEQILDFQRALSRWVANDPQTWAEPSVYLESMGSDGKYRFRLIYLFIHFFSSSSSFALA